VRGKEPDFYPKSGPKNSVHKNECLCRSLSASFYGAFLGKKCRVCTTALKALAQRGTPVTRGPHRALLLKRLCRHKRLSVLTLYASGPLTSHSPKSWACGSRREK